MTTTKNNMSLLCPICSAAKIIVYLNTEEERMFHFLEEHQPYELCWAYNDLLSICERNHMLKNKEVMK